MTQHEDIHLNPVRIFALICAAPYLLSATILLLMAWWFSPLFILCSLLACATAMYKMFLVRSYSYWVSADFIRVSKGILFKRTDQLDMYRVRDFVITRPLVYQIFGLMDLTLITTDVTNKICRLTGIPASDLLDTIRERVQEARRKNQVYEIIKE
ncbi:PH domain-containing protein [Mucilaginibacter sp. UC70_90]